MKPRKPRMPSLAERAGVDYPHPGHRRGFDPRVREYLTCLAEALAGKDDDVLLQTLCGGVWWLHRAEAELLAFELRELLEVGP